MYETIIIAITLSPLKEVEITRLGPGIGLNPPSKREVQTSACPLMVIEYSLSTQTLTLVSRGKLFSDSMWIILERILGDA
jgi:hypothetical protein